MIEKKTGPLDIVAEGISKHFGTVTGRTSSAAPRQFTDTAAVHMAEDDDMATKYVATRRAEAERLMSDLVWKSNMAGTVVTAPIYKVLIQHELSPRSLHATPVWGEMFFINSDEDPVTFGSFNCMLAYILKRWW